MPTLHITSVYALLSEFPGAKHIATAHLTRLTNLLSESSKGRYGKDTAITFRDAARASIGSNMPAKSLELKHTIKLIQELDSEIDEIENFIDRALILKNGEIAADVRMDALRQENKSLQSLMKEVTGYKEGNLEELLS